MSGRTELVYLPEDVFQLAEKIREDFGMSRSGFYRYAIIKLLQDRGLLPTKTNEALKKKEKPQSNSGEKEG